MRSKFENFDFLRVCQYSTFDVGRSTCPQCLDSGVSSIQSFCLYADVSTNQMHYAWQAGVRRSIFSLFRPPEVSYEVSGFSTFET